MPAAGVLRFDDEVFVTQVRYGDVVVRHHAWRDHWFKINCTTDLRGRLIETTAPDDVPPFAFNCDIATPMVRHADAVFAVDLWLDVLVRGDGVTRGVYDHDEFDDAITRSWLSEREQAGARAGLEELIDLIDRRALVDFLTELHPFVPTGTRHGARRPQPGRTAAVGVARFVVNGREVTASIGGQDWRVAWCHVSDPPPGSPHGAEAVCVADRRIVLVSRDGQRWGLPAGRPEADEDWGDALRCEVREEACAEVTSATLLGFTRGVCVRGPQEGLVLVRSHWRAAVRLLSWQPRFEMVHRRLVPADEAFAQLSIPEGLSSLYRRMFAAAGISTAGP
jgi:ADP-ribose pyrophosphatase YjhB (NUDIX family)